MLQFKVLDFSHCEINFAGVWNVELRPTISTGLTKTSRDAGTPSLGPVSHQVDRRDSVGTITVSDAGTP